VPELNSALGEVNLAMRRDLSQEIDEAEYLAEFNAIDR
jgi:hypothetical protein